MSFLNTNDRIINLANVSNINIIRDRNRIVFNLNYNIQIPSDQSTKLISDYVYWDAINTEDLKQNLQHLKSNTYFKANFIDEVNDSGYININEISSIKFSEKKLRIIFNLSHPVTFHDLDRKERITSEFVYVNCSSFAQYKDYATYVKQILIRDKNGNSN